MTYGATLLAALAGPALLVACGLGLVQLLPGLPRLSVPGRVGLAYLLGVAFCGTASFAASHLFGVVFRRTFFLPLLLVPPLLALAARVLGPRGPRGPRALVPRRSWPVLLATLAGTIVTAVLLLDAVTIPPLGFDGRMTWLPQARWMRAERTVTPSVLTDPIYYVMHPQYPPLMALARVAVAETLDLPAGEERATRSLDAAFFPAFLLALYAGARSLAGSRAAAAVTTLAALAPQLSFVHEGGARGSYSDFPLAALAGAGAFVLLRGRGVSAGLGGGLLLAGAALSKNEGAPVAAAVILGAALRAALRLRARRREGLSSAPALRKLLPIGTGVAVLAGALLLLGSWRSSIPNRNDERYRIERLEDLAPGPIAEKVSRAAPVMLRRTYEFWVWGALWALVPAALLLGAPWWRSPAALSLLPPALAPPAVALAAYGWHWDPAGLADVTWSRLLMQALIPLLLLSAIALRPVLGLRGAKEPYRGAR